MVHGNFLLRSQNQPINCKQTYFNAEKYRAGPINQINAHINATVMSSCGLIISPITLVLREDQG